MGPESFEERYRKRLLRDIRRSAIAGMIELYKEPGCLCNPDTLTWCIKHVEHSTKSNGEGD